jgi:uncharacterized membrane protein YraQ (UPF0718 family)
VYIDLRSEYKNIIWFISLFLFIYFLPIYQSKIAFAVSEAFSLLHWYAREHVLFCLIPAFFIAGIIAVFFSQTMVMKYLGTTASKWLSYSIASISGTALAVCSCTILPLFAGIYKRGAGLGPAITFLYAGPAINILAIILTARILGLELGIVRIVSAVIFAIFIGLIMNMIFRREEVKRVEIQPTSAESVENIPLKQNVSLFILLVGILIFVTWSKPETTSGFWYTVFLLKWPITSFFGVMLSLFLVITFNIKKIYIVSAILLVGIMSFIYLDQPIIPFSIALIILSIILGISGEGSRMWLESSWNFAKQILPLLAIGILMAGFFLGSPEKSGGIVPIHWITNTVGGNSISANFFASLIGVLMYFATLTEIPILQALLSSGMGKGPALALLLSGPAVSLPNMLVIRSVIGSRKTIFFAGLVVFMSTICGLIYGSLF